MLFSEIRFQQTNEIRLFLPNVAFSVISVVSYQSSILIKAYTKCYETIVGELVISGDVIAFQSRSLHRNMFIFFVIFDSYFSLVFLSQLCYVSNKARNLAEWLALVCAQMNIFLQRKERKKYFTNSNSCGKMMSGCTAGKYSVEFVSKHFIVRS